ncbi:MAG: hypothetical protein HRU09_06800 [Oligoflexales bacterium]|nr:hypothetical protein [Oligoflexales bacterium]
MKLIGLMGSVCLASTCFGGNWFSAVEEPLPERVQELVEERLDLVGEFELTADKEEHDVYRLRVMNLSFGNLLSRQAHLVFKNQWAREWYQQKSYRRPSESRMLVLANSDLDEVCRYYLGSSASYAGSYKAQRLGSRRFSLNFVRIMDEYNYSIKRSFSGKNILGDVSCRLDLEG